MTPTLTHSRRPQLLALEARYAPAVLSDNLAAPTAGTRAATGGTEYAASFKTDASTYTLNSVALDLAVPASGSATVSIYSDGGSKPGTLISTLTPPASYPTTTPAATTFTSTGLTLTANSTYWVVLSAPSGTANLAFAADDSGTGTGFTHAWAATTDGGANWASPTTLPPQMSVTATAPATGAGAVAFGSATYAASETAGSATVTLVRTGGTTGAVRVTVSAAAGSTATAGSDYAGLPTTVDFADGQSTATFTFTIVRDSTSESAETLDLVLGSPTNGAVLGARATAAVTITDAGPVTTKLTAVGVGAGGSPVVYVYNASGALVRTIQAYDSSFTGGVRVATADVNHDGVDDVITGAGPGGGPDVKVFDGATGAQIISFLAFESTFTGGVFVAAGDLNADGYAEVVVTPDEGGGPVVAVYNGAALAVGTDGQAARFLGINDANFRGGARAAVGDLNGDGFADVVVAAGYGGGPRVSVYDGASLAAGRFTHPVGDFFVFDESLRNGVYVAVGDVNADGYGDVVVGGGPGGGPRVLVASGKTLLASGPTAAVGNPLANFFAGDASNRGGVPVAAGDRNADGYADVVTGAGDGGGATASAYSGKSLTAGGTDELFSVNPVPNFTGGVYVG